MHLKLFTLLLLALVLPVFTYIAAFMAFGWVGLVITTILILIQYYTGRAIHEISNNIKDFYYGD